MLASDTKDPSVQKENMHWTRNLMLEYIIETWIQIIYMSIDRHHKE